ncbi:alpha/beta hydrolase [Mycobacterium sp. ITM-2016-00317]|uniref:alpha/beta fold hydrolase n=1 Tax=Mycobacterium sp. ITM-2016-00317 TaxID=2099694 RepID=UPI00287FC50A|nr:alpha/beta hydrolase [Mycobacterium sp. ITM-2016-00317]WNG86605.1 alpha/beta hydrolase [Mycobacterium sp. ITM-2016-00317]
MSRRTFGGLTLAAAAGIVGSGLGASAHAAPGGVPAAATLARNVVLVHGLYADGSSWIDVVPHLQNAGLNVAVVQNPLTTLADAAAETRRVLALQHGPTVLAGHSWSGTVVSEVGDDPSVSSLVYVSARAPDAGEDFPALAKRFPTAPASAGVVVASDGYAQLNEAAFLSDFAAGVPVERARALFAVQGRNRATLPAERTTAAAWHAKPSWYQVSTQDRTINPDLQRFLAHRMGARTIELDTSHVSLITRPREVADLILAAAGIAV